MKKNVNAKPLGGINIHDLAIGIHELLDSPPADYMIHFKTYLSEEEEKEFQKRVN